MHRFALVQELKKLKSLRVTLHLETASNSIEEFKVLTNRLN